MQYDLKMPDANLPDTDRRLMARFRAGDREAFTLIYQTHSRAVFRFALHMSGDAMKAADIAQDVFVWLIHHPGHFDPSRGNLGPFLIGVARRYLLRRWRNERKWILLEASNFKTPASSAYSGSVLLITDGDVTPLPMRYTPSGNGAWHHAPTQVRTTAAGTAFPQNIKAGLLPVLHPIEWAC
jgi:hypothetical protein